MKKVVAILCTMMLVTTLAGTASALIIVNGGFDDGLNGWNVDPASKVSVVDEAAELITTSSIGQHIFWTAGDVLSFDWDFWVQNSIDRDYSLFTINNSSGTVAEVTFHVAAQNTPASWLGPQNYQYTFTEDGNGYLKFVAVNALYPNWQNSILRVDNVGSPVPEPSTILLFGSGLAGLAFFRRKKKKDLR